MGIKKETTFFNPGFVSFFLQISMFTRLEKREVWKIMGPCKSKVMAYFEHITVLINDPINRPKFSPEIWLKIDNNFSLASCALPENTENFKMTIQNNFLHCDQVPYCPSINAFLVQLLFCNIYICKVFTNGCCNTSPDHV